MKLKEREREREEVDTRMSIVGEDERKERHKRCREETDIRGKGRRGGSICL